MTDDNARPAHRRRRRKRITPRFYWMMAALIFTLYLGYGYVDGILRIVQLRGEIRTAQQEVMVLETRNQQLRHELARLQSDEYIEQVARRELGLVMPGERVYVVVTEDGDPVDDGWSGGVP